MMTLTAARKTRLTRRIVPLLRREIKRAGTDPAIPDFSGYRPQTRCGRAAVAVRRLSWLRTGVGRDELGSLSERRLLVAEVRGVRRRRGGAPRSGARRR